MTDAEGQAPIARVIDIAGRDELAASLGVVVVEIAEERIVVELAVDDRHVGWHGLCHGGVLFTLADIVMSWSSNRFPDRALATRAEVEFLGAVHRGDRVVAEGLETFRRGRTAICDVTMRVGGEVVALFRGTTLRPNVTGK